MPSSTSQQLSDFKFKPRPKTYSSVRDFVHRNDTESGVITNFLTVLAFARHCEHFPVYDKSMLAVYTVDSPNPGHTWLSIYHDTMGMIAQVELCRTLPHFLSTFTNHGIHVNPEQSEF